MDSTVALSPAPASIRSSWVFRSRIRTDIDCWDRAVCATDCFMASAVRKKHCVAKLGVAADEAADGDADALLLLLLLPLLLDAAVLLVGARVPKWRPFGMCRWPVALIQGSLSSGARRRGISLGKASSSAPMDRKNSSPLVDGVRDKLKP